LTSGASTDPPISLAVAFSIRGRFLLRSSLSCCSIKCPVLRPPFFFPLGKNRVPLRRLIQPGLRAAGPARSPSLDKGSNPFLEAFSFTPALLVLRRLVPPRLVRPLLLLLSPSLRSRPPRRRDHGFCLFALLAHTRSTTRRSSALLLFHDPPFRRWSLGNLYIFFPSLVLRGSSSQSLHAIFFFSFPPK